MQQLRIKLEPDLKTAEDRFPVVFQLIEDYARMVDEIGDDDRSLYIKLEEQLHDITGKDMSKFNLSEWWEEEGQEVLAFRISLPDPVRAPDIDIDELAEIVRRIKEFDFSNPSDGKFAMDFRIYLDSYFHDLLKLNFHNYNLKLFQRNRDKNGKYFSYQTDEIIKVLWNN